MTGLYAAISSIGGCRWSSWTRDLVPRETLGSFFSRRWTLALPVGIVLSPAASAFLDWWKLGHPEGVPVGYSIIFVGGVLCGYAGICMLGRIPEPALQGGTNRVLSAIFSAGPSRARPSAN